MRAPADLLLHVCCGPCSTVAVPAWRERGVEPAGWFHNPNIQPVAELARRADSMRRYAAAAGLRLIEDGGLQTTSPTEATEGGGSQASFRPGLIEKGGAQAMAVTARRSPERGADEAPWAVTARGEAPSGLDVSAWDAWRAAQETAAPEQRCASCLRLRLDAAAAAARRLGFARFSTTLSVSPYQRHDLIIAAGDAAAARHGVAFVYLDGRDRFPKSYGESRRLHLYRQPYCGCAASKWERWHERQAARRRRGAARTAAAATTAAATERR